MDESTVSVHLLNGPYVRIGPSRVAVPEGSKRLLVLISIRRCLPRSATAGLLWPDVDRPRAAGNLRSASWRLRGAGIPVLLDHDGVLRLDPRVSVDTEVLARRAEELTPQRCTQDDLAMLPNAVDALDLLPGWYEDWVSAERNRLRLLMLQAIDVISDHLRRSGRCAEAVDAALIAATADPLRQSSQAALIAAHLGEGNLGEARRAYLAYRDLLIAEFGLEPPPRLAALVGVERAVERLRPSGQAPRDALVRGQRLRADVAGSLARPRQATSSVSWRDGSTPSSRRSSRANAT
jgi:DNA-binding SARP family transcriptional activator